MRTRLVMGIAAVLALAACSTSKDAATPETAAPQTTAATSSSAGSTDATTAPSETTPVESTFPPVVDDRAPGVTDDTIKIGVTFPDLTSITTTNHGDYAKAYQVAIDQLNAAGGINGRQLEAVIAPVAIGGTDAATAACTRLTQDEQVFLVTGFMNADDVLCYVDDNETIALGGDMTPERLDKAKVLWLTTEPSQTQAVTGLQRLAEEGRLSGKVGIVSTVGSEALYDVELKPIFEANGVDVVEVAYLEANTGQVDENQTLQTTTNLAEKFKSEGVDQLLMLANTAVYMPKGVANTDWRPQLIFPDFNGSTTYAKSDGADLSVMEGAITVGMFDWNQNFPSLGDPTKACLDYQEQQQGITLKPTSELAPGEPKPIVSSITACRNIALIAAILEKAGSDLNYGTFTTAADNLGEVILPGYPDPWNFDRDHPDGNPPLYVYNWDTALKLMVPEQN